MTLARLTSASAGLRPLLEASELTPSHKGSPVVQINVGSSLNLCQLPFAAAQAATAVGVGKQEKVSSCDGGINKRRVDKTLRKSTTLTNTKITDKALGSVIEDSQSYLSKNTGENQQLQKRFNAGRKLIDPERYCFESQKKIDEL